MKYVILIHNNAAVVDMFAAMTEEQRAAAYQLYWTIESDLEQSGELVDSKAVDDRTQKVVRRGLAGTVVSDAPAPESADVVSGYYLVDVASADRAYEIAAQFPEAEVSGGIRVARALTQEDFDAMS